MESSVPGAVATGLTLAGSNDQETNDRFRPRLRLCPVASTTPRGLPARGPRSAPGTDLIPQTKTLPTGGKARATFIFRKWLHKFIATLSQPWVSASAVGCAHRFS